MQRLTARVRCVEGLSPKRLGQAVEHHTGDHREKYLLAFAFGHLRDSGLLEIKTQAEKYVVLAVLNLVECIACTAPPTR